jgi:hypothetical protein
MRPSKEVHEKYFRERGADPWGTDTPLVQERLDETLRFIRRFLPSDFAGTLVEIGAHNGNFTRQLAESYPAAAIAASDIIRVAWDQASAVAPFPPSVSFQWCEMADFKWPQSAKAPAALLLMECLYYLSPAQQREALAILLRIVPATLVFISGPLGSDPNYFDENTLDEYLRPLGFRCVAIRVATTNEAFLGLYGWYQDWMIKGLSWVTSLWPRGFSRLGFSSLLAMRGSYLGKLKRKVRARMDTNVNLRTKYARQVIYAFAR